MGEVPSQLSTDPLAQAISIDVMFAIASPHHSITLNQDTIDINDYWNKRDRISEADIWIVGTH